MPSILFLVGESTTAANDNHLRLPRAFADIGWETVVADHDQVRFDGRQVRAGSEEAGRFHLIWPLGFGRRQSFYDRMQLLRQLNQGRFVNAVDAYTYLHGKLPPVAPSSQPRVLPGDENAGGLPIDGSSALHPRGNQNLDDHRPPHRALADHYPETHAAASAQHLLNCLDDATPWVLKPSGASFGRDVQLIRADSVGRRAIRKLVERDGFAVLQRYVASIECGETRCLLARGELVGCYRRVPAAGDFRANLAAGASVEAHDPSPRERELIGKIGQWLLTAGVGFAAADIAWPYLIEINVANPGGLATLESLSGADPTPRAVELICFNVQAADSE